MPICPQCLKENPELGAKCPRCANSYYVYDAAAESAERDPYIGQKAGNKYVIVARISEGGMGTVYRALQLPVEREVAFKVLRAELEDNDEVRDRFTREARAVSKINHPNIITLHDFGFDASDYPYMVMEYAPGQSLDEWIYGDGITLERVVHVMRQMLSALADAHDQGVVHRDLKPENIMVTGTGTDRDFIKLLDFGIARLVNEQATEGLTREGEVFGTPHYMSPEQAEGETGIGPPADVYALGIMLYELLCRECPFDAPKPLSILFKQINEKLPPLNPRPGLTVPAALENLMRKATSKNPDQRYRTAGEMLEALEQIDNAERSGIVQTSHSSESADQTTQRGIGERRASKASQPGTTSETPGSNTGQHQTDQQRDKVATANTLGFDDEKHGQRPDRSRTGPPSQNDVSVDEPTDELFDLDDVPDNEDNSTILAVIAALTVLVIAGFTTLTVMSGESDSAAATNSSGQADASTVVADNRLAEADTGATTGSLAAGGADAGSADENNMRADQRVDTGGESDEHAADPIAQEENRDESGGAAGGSASESDDEPAPATASSEATDESGTGGTQTVGGGREQEAAAEEADLETDLNPAPSSGQSDSTSSSSSETESGSESEPGPQKWGSPSPSTSSDDSNEGSDDDSEEIEKFGAPDKQKKQDDGPEKFDAPSKFEAPD